MLENGKLNALVGAGNFGYPASFVEPLLKGKFIAIGGVDGYSTEDLLTPATRALVVAAFAKVRKHGGSVIGYYRNTETPAGMLSEINNLDPVKQRLANCVSEIGTVGSSPQFYVFCRFVRVRHPHKSTK